MSRKTDAKLDTAARALSKVGGVAGEVVANAVLRPFRSNGPCTCGKADCPNR